MKIPAWAIKRTELKFLNHKVVEKIISTDSKIVCHTISTSNSSESHNNQHQMSYHHYWLCLKVNWYLHTRVHYHHSHHHHHNEIDCRIRHRAIIESNVTGNGYRLIWCWHVCRIIAPPSKLACCTRISKYRYLIDAEFTANIICIADTQRHYNPYSVGCCTELILNIRTNVYVHKINNFALMMLMMYYVYHTRREYMYIQCK